MLSVAELSSTDVGSSCASELYSYGQVHPSFVRSVSVPALVTPIISGDIATLEAGTQPHQFSLAEPNELPELHTPSCL